MAGFSIGGSASKSKSSSTTIQDLLQQSKERSLANTSSDTTEITTAFDAASKEKLDTLLSTLTASQDDLGKGYSKDQAILDSQAAVKNLFTQYKQEALPQIVAQGAQGGVYNSTALQGLADNAFATTVAKGAELQQQAIAQYAGIEQTAKNSGMEAILATLGLEAKAFGSATGTGKSKTEAEAEGTQTTKSTTQQKGKSSTVGMSIGYS